MALRHGDLWKWRVSDCSLYSEGKHKVCECPVQHLPRCVSVLLFPFNVFIFFKSPVGLLFINAKEVEFLVQRLGLCFSICKMICFGPIIIKLLLTPKSDCQGH